MTACSTKTRIYQTLVVSVLLYASETWTHTRCRCQDTRGLPHEMSTADPPHPLAGSRSQRRGRRAYTGLHPVMESIRRRREAIFGHVARMSPKHSSSPSIATIQVETSLGRRPDRDWVRSSGRPRNRWIDQLRQDHQRPPADLMASSHPAWSQWSDATVLDDYAMTTTKRP